MVDYLYQSKINKKKKCQRRIPVNSKYNLSKKFINDKERKAQRYFEICNNLFEVENKIIKNLRFTSTNIFIIIKTRSSTLITTQIDFVPLQKFYSTSA